MLRVVYIGTQVTGSGGHRLGEYTAQFSAHAPACGTGNFLHLNIQQTKLQLPTAKSVNWVCIKSLLASP